MLAATIDPVARAALCHRLVEVHLDLTYQVADRFWCPEPGREDIRQVAAFALVEAVNRFDPARHMAFSAFAVPTVSGSIKRHFRDQTWMLHPPRRVKELRLRIRAVSDLLTQQLRHLPTVADLAEHLDCSPKDVLEALGTDYAMRPLSIDAPTRADGDATLATVLGHPDAAYTNVDDVETLRPLLAELSERELRVIAMRFAGNLTQSQIAEQLGCSQMHVSRMLRSTIRRLRRRLRTRPTRKGGHGAISQRGPTELATPTPPQSDRGARASGRPTGDRAAPACRTPATGRRGATDQTQSQPTVRRLRQSTRDVRDGPLVTGAPDTPGPRR
jgi:RNA polymerase sigma-B factor